MRMRSFMMLGALLGAVPAAAQQPPARAGMPMPAMQQCMEMMGGPPAMMLLMHREQLALTADQVTRLETIRDGMQSSMSTHMEPIRAAHARAAELLRADAPDFDEYEDALEDAAEHMVAAHVAMVRMNVEAGQVLTAEQRAQLQTLQPMGAMHGDTTRRPGMPMRPRADSTARPGMMPGMQHGAPMGDMQHMHQMMMMHCAMMGADAPGGMH